MRTETVVTQRAWYPFGPDGPGLPERSELRVYLSKRDRTVLANAATLLGQLREAVDPHQWLEYGTAADIEERCMTIASAEAFVSEVAQMGQYVVVDDQPRLVIGGGAMRGGTA